MAANNVVKAVQDKWEALTAANFPSATVPPIALDDMPVTNATGTQQYPPYAIIKDGGITPDYDFEHNTQESSQITIEVYGLAPDVAQCVEAAKYNGGAINAKSGFDFGTLAFDAGSGKRVLHEMKRVGERWSYSGVSKNGQRFYLCELTYSIVVRRTL